MFEKGEFYKVKNTVVIATSSTTLEDALDYFNGKNNCPISLALSSLETIEQTDDSLVFVSYVDELTASHIKVLLETFDDFTIKEVVNCSECGEPYYEMQIKAVLHHPTASNWEEVDL